MLKTTITKHAWFKPALLAIIFVGLVILGSQLIIFSHPRPFHLYLDYLNKNTQRGQSVAVYSKEEFARKYLGVGGGAYQPSEFTRLFQEYFKYPGVRENNLFDIYKVSDQNIPCQVNIFGVSKKRDLVYVSSRNVCLKNGSPTK